MNLLNDKWEAIKKAIEVLQATPTIKRLDGAGWSVYFVGKVIRVDIKDE